MSFVKRPIRQKLLEVGFLSIERVPFFFSLEPLLLIYLTIQLWLKYVSVAVKSRKNVIVNELDVFQGSSA